MQENIQRMLKVFENSNEFQRSVFIDVVNDLLNATFKKTDINLDEVPGGVDIRKMLQSIKNTIQRYYATTKELNEDYKSIVEEYNQLQANKPKSHDTIALFNYRKESVLFLKTTTGKSVREIY
jgi:hypothetical protein